MLSNTSRFARLAERASYFSPPHTPSLVLHLHEAKLFLPRSLHLPKRIYHSFFSPCERSKQVASSSFLSTTSQNLFRFIWLFMPRMPVDMPVVIRHAAILFRFEQIPVRELDGSSIELECLSSLLSMYYRAKLLLLSMRESFVIIRREVNNHLSLNLPTYA